MEKIVARLEKLAGSPDQDVHQIYLVKDKFGLKDKTPYSGKGMYGEKCVGFEVEVGLLKKVEQALSRHAVSYKVDHFGENYIIFFPHIDPVQKNDTLY